MRIVSLNAWGGLRFDELTAWLPTVGADVLCLQEMTNVPGVSGWITFDDGERHLPQRADLTADVAALLPGHRPFFLTSNSGPITDGAGDGHRQDFGIGTFVDQELSIIATSAGFVHDRHRVQESWPTSGRPRIAHGVRVHDHEQDRPVTIVHLHGLRDAEGKHDTPARETQAHRLARFVEDLREPGDLTVVCGDLNLLPDSRTFEILGEIGLVDLVGTADTRTSLYPKPLRHANYLLVSDPDAVESLEIPARPEVSDHRPLILDL